MAGFSRANLRLVPPPGGPAIANDDITIDVAEEPDDLQANDEGQILRIEHGDGSVTISMNDRPLIPSGDAPNSGDWFRNLAEELSEDTLGTVAEDLLRGVSDDETSRKEWIDSVATFVRLLGVTPEVPNVSAGSTDGAPVEGMSKVRHPLLLEAVLRFQANARGEFLPADGPMKIRDDSISAGVEMELLADALEKDMNHYLTAHATEYYPDTDRMWFRLGLEGTAFKKVYRCPLRMRPVSETVTAENLIVSNDATDLANARRVTHRLMMSRTTIRRMQIIGAYRDIDLGTPVEPTLDEAQREMRRQQGITDTTLNPDDRDRQLYEIYCDLDLVGYEHMWKGKPSGLEIPYRVTIDVTSRQVLSLVRDYVEDEASELPKRRETFVQYCYVPGFGFYALGLGHILGNTDNALTAAWREMLDNGMFANFPGFLVAKGATRQQTSILRVPPGGGAPIDTLGKPISQAVMPLPYQTTQMPPLMALIDSMATTGARIGGTAEIQVGEGKQDAPVGTTLALIDQATKVENSVHKRIHTAQGQEFKLIVALFREHPEDFLRTEKKDSNFAWDAQTFLQALDTCELVPQADPNTSSQLQRLMKAMGIKQLQAQSQSLYDPIAVDTYALKTMGVNNPQQFFVPPQSMAQPPPELQQMQAEMQSKLQQANAKTMDANSKAAMAKAKLAETQAKIAQGGFAKAGGAAAPPSPLDAINARAKMMDAETRRFDAHAKIQETDQQSADRAADRQAEQHSDQVDLVKALLAHHADIGESMFAHAHEAREGALDREADLKQAKIAAKAKPKGKTNG